MRVVLEETRRGFAGDTETPAAAVDDDELRTVDEGGRGRRLCKKAE